MGMKKTTSLKASFWKFLCMLLIGLIGAVVIPFSLILAGTSTGLITYADYSERSAKNLVPVIAATPDLTDVQLPMGCKYLVLDKNYQVTETTLEGDDLDRAMEYAISGKINTNLNKQYLLVTRENEYVVLQYYIGSQFTNEWLYEHFPSPEILLYILIAINCIAVCVILTAKFAKNMRAQLSPLFEATRQVAGQNLDFEVGHSKIKEFEDVLCSFANMKDNLKISLEKQWHAEQLQREQIAALAHDLKTPLTVIQGNIDLISETELDDEQRLYAGYITESSEQIGIYIKTLIDISRTVAGYQLHLEKFDIAESDRQVSPDKKGTFGMYLGGKWYKLTAHKDIMSDDPVDGLDVAVLQDNLLAPVLGIGDPKTDKRIDFVGGIRGLSELEKRCREDCVVAFSMYATSIAELFAVADAGKLMPPKSTWFEPKLRSGLFIHRI